MSKTGILFSLIFLAIVGAALWLAWPTSEVTITQTGLSGSNTTTTIAVTTVDTYSGITPEESGNVINVVQLIVGLLIVTGITLLLIRKKRAKIFMLVAVGLGYIVSLSLIFARLNIAIGDLLAIILAIVFAAINFKYPRWWMVDITGFILAVGASALIGVTLGLVPMLLLLVFLAIYDIISVYKTKHMVAMAQGIIDSGTPFALFIIPKTKEATTSPEVKLDMTTPRKKREVSIIGLGDYIIPTVLVISANKFIRTATVYGLSIPAIGAILGGIFGYFLLSWIADKYPQAHAGLPPINGGTITGFLIACALTGAWGWL